MPPVIILLLAAVAFLAGWFGTIFVRHHAERLGLVQVPNERSSHVRPTPQGGGIAISLASLSGLVLAGYQDGTLLVVCVLMLVIAGLGLADDILNISPAIRFPVQIVALAVLVWWAHPLPALELPFGLVVDGFAPSALVLVAGLWWLNLFNFMDGIDGIAASQSIVILMGGMALAILADGSALTSPMAMAVFVAAAATAGFLIMNWAPAKIFMGDAGSNTLAVLILALALRTTGSGLMDYPAWLLLMAPFSADATVTLVKRALRGERPWHAHRRHAYQQLSREYGHAPITLLYTGLTAFVALPAAWLAQATPSLSWWLVLLVYAVLVCLSLWGGSGAATERSRPD